MNDTMSSPESRVSPLRLVFSRIQTWGIAVTKLASNARIRRRVSTMELRFSLPINLLFGLASFVTAANLYYTYPILNKIADSFEITYQRSSLIPTLMQAGYGSGILLLCPLADRTRVRPFVLGLVLITLILWIALCLTDGFHPFCALSFLAAFTTITPQLMLPLASSITPPATRATAISIVFSGLMLGMLFPRVISGLIAQFTAWRNIYWTASGLQAILFALLWVFMPDYPSDNASDTNYLYMLWGIIRLIFRQPILAYACIMTFFSNAVFASYWTTLTALLSSPAYKFTPWKICLFALIGIAPLALVPPYSRMVIDRFVPSFSVVLGLLVAFIGVVIGTYTATLSIAGVVVQAITIDFGVQTASIAYRAAIYTATPHARNRANVAFTVSAFVGQLIGTSTGNALYARGG